MQAVKRVFVVSVAFFLIFSVFAGSDSALAAFGRGQGWDNRDAGKFENPLRDWTGTVVAVGDGDSFRVRRGRKTVKVRLYGVDSPEYKQPYGREARQTARRLMAGREVVVRPLYRDPYGRDIALVWVDGLFINRELVRRGAAWVYPRFCKSREFCEDLNRLQDEARASRVGLWRDDRPETPWDWKHRHPDRR